MSLISTQNQQMTEHVNQLVQGLSVKVIKLMSNIHLICQTTLYSIGRLNNGSGLFSILYRTSLNGANIVYILPTGPNIVIVVENFDYDRLCNKEKTYTYNTLTIKYSVGHTLDVVRQYELQQDKRNIYLKIVEHYQPTHNLIVII